MISSKGLPEYVNQSGGGPEVRLNGWHAFGSGMPGRPGHFGTAILLFCQLGGSEIPVFSSVTGIPWSMVRLKLHTPLYFKGFAA